MIEYEIAKRLGLEKDYEFTNDIEWVNFMLKPVGITIDDFAGEPILYATQKVVYRKYTKAGFRTPSKKVEFFSETYKKNQYDPIPVYREVITRKEWKGETREKYPYLGTTRKPFEYVHTKFRNLDFLKRLYPDPLVMIHPEDASASEVQDGDMVEIRSPYGTVRMKAKVSSDCKRGMVVADFGWGNPWDDPETCANALSTGDVWDPVSGGTPNRLFYCNLEPVKY